MKYYIDKFKDTYKTYIKVPKLEAGDTIELMVEKNDDYSPDNTIFPLFDTFNGDDLDTDKWDDSNVKGDYSVSDKLNMWNDWDSGLFNNCCDGSCYYKGVESKDKFKIPLKLVTHCYMENYDTDSGCGITGVAVALKEKFQVSTSADSDDKKGITLRVGDNQHDDLGVKKIPNESYKFDCIIRSNNSVIIPSWTDNITNDEDVDTDEAPIVLVGDSDDDNIIDHLTKFFLYTPYDLEITITDLDDKVKVTIKNNEDVDLSDFIAEVDLSDYLDNEDTGLYIYDMSVKVLFFNPDDEKVYTYDKDNSEWVVVTDNINDLTQDDFDNQGLKSPVYLDKDTLQDLNSTLKVLLNRENTDNIQGIVAGIPTKKIIAMNTAINTSDWKTINSCSLLNTGDNGDIKFVVSNKETLDEWYYYDLDNDEWKKLLDDTIDIDNTDTLNNIWDKGNKPDDTDDIDFQSLNTTGNLAFAFVLEKDREVTNISFNVDTKEYYAKAPDDYTEIGIRENINITFIKEGNYKILYLK